MECDRHGGPRRDETPLTDKWPVECENVTGGRPSVLTNKELVEALIYEGYAVRERHDCACRLDALRIEAVLRLERPAL